MGRRLLAAVAVLLSGAAIASGLAQSAPRAVTATPNLTGDWRNPDAPTAPPWHLAATADLNTLTGSWQGGAGHSGLRGTFTATLRGTVYSGTLQIVEGSLHVTGTIAFTILGQDKVSVTYQQSNGPSGTFELDREAETQTTATVRKLQSELAKLGFYTGPIDGRLDPQTTDAIKRFQHQAGLPADGVCDAQCLAALAKATAGGETTNTPATAALAKLQSELARLGLYTGPIDGRLDPRTTGAIKTFQHDVGIPADGKCDAPCLAALKRALGLDDPARPPGAAPTSPSTVMKLQSDLSKLGLYAGPVDGRVDPRTIAAIKTFQHQAGLPADGKCALPCQLAIVNALTR
jgi:peptidoglycan hydrolase-like protein with peptidoglycan-binding domain